MVAFVASFATFFILLNVERNMLRSYEKVYVWCAKEEMARGKQINESDLGICFEQVEVDKGSVPEKTVMEIRDLLDMQAEIRIPKGTVLTQTMFTDEADYVRGLGKPVVAGCKGDDLFQLVSGVLRKGDQVHVYTVNEEMEETYLLWENIMVYQAFDAAGNVIAPEDTTTPAARVNLLLEEGYAEQFYSELYRGSLRVVKVWD